MGSWAMTQVGHLVRGDRDRTTSRRYPPDRPGLESRPVRLPTSPETLPHSMQSFSIIPGKESSHGPCKCCGDTTRTVWGKVHRDGAMHALYWVRWSPQHLDDVAHWRVVVGAWDEGTGPNARSAVALMSRFDGGRPSFMVVDPTAIALGPGQSAPAISLGRDEVVGQPIAKHVFAIVDEVMIKDPRVGQMMVDMWKAEPARWWRWLKKRVRWPRRRMHAAHA